MGLISELRRRNVLRMAMLYVVAAWLIMQVTEVLMTLTGLPLWSGQAALAVLAIGFPIALVFSWFYELTPEGISLEKDVEPHESITRITGRRIDFIVIALLCAAIVLFAYDKWGIRGPPQQSIAVLPFENMSSDPDNEYFSDGISEEILNLLSQVPELIVISRTSAFSFKGQKVDMPTIADELNVAHILEGSVRKSGDQLRITVQLIEVESNRHLWSKSFDRELEDVFAIQDEIASAVVGALKATVLDEKPKSETTNPQAYALYLQARHLVRFPAGDNLVLPEELLKRALDIAPSFAPAWTELSHVYRLQSAVLNARPVDEGFELAREAIQKALTMNPEYGPAYTALAQIEGLYDWDFAAAFRHLDRALMLNPRDVYTLRIAAARAYMLGHFAEAIDLNRKVIALDPVWPGGYGSFARTLRAAGRFDEAVAMSRKALSLSSDRSIGRYLGLGKSLLAQGDASAALAAMEQEPADVYRLTGTAIAQHALGNASASDAALQELIENWSSVAAYQVAQVFAYRGQNDDAFDWLERAYDNRDSGLPMLLPDPLLSSLREDPRWEPFLDKMGLPH